MFGPKGESELSKKSFVELCLAWPRKNGPIKAVDDEINSITYAVDLARPVKLLLEEQRPYGIYHITNSGQGSWYDFAKEIFSITGKRSKCYYQYHQRIFPQSPAPKKISFVKHQTAASLRSWQEALAEFLKS